MGVQRSLRAALAFAIPLTLSFSIGSAETRDRIGVRILFGITDRQSTRWDGSLSLKYARVVSIEPWRIGDFVTMQKFEVNNVISGTSWKISTHESRLFKLRGPEFEGAVMGPVDANGIMVQLQNTGPNAELSIHTAQGDFSVRISDLPYGKVVHELDGRVRIDCVPPVTRITNDPQEQDYPAAAVKDGTVWLAYTEFIHNPDHDRLRVPLQEAPRDFSAYLARTGGDRVLARAFRDSHWSAPIEISGGGDVYRPAIAIDGSGRPWVFWSQNDGGNFDIRACPIENDKAGKPVRLSSEAGTDMDPAAATDAKGNVWVAWQAWRNGHATILYSRQSGTTFPPGKAVAPESGNQWDPAIAADGSGDVAVAWDSYTNGNYDVMMRAARNGVWGQVTRVAATARYEAYPSIAYDPAGRLWVAYEEGGERWGKDFGVAETTGLALYEGRAIRLRGFAPGGQPIRTRTDPGERMEGPTSNHIDNGHQNDSDAWLKPNPERIKMRKASDELPDVIAPRNTSPRMTIDRSGRIWLAYRINSPLTLTQLGAIWTESVVSYDGSQWTGPIYLSHSDNFLDNRPAVVSTGPGQVTIVGSSDNRSEFQMTADNSVVATSVTGRYPLIHDPHQNDLFANTIVLGPAQGKMETDAAPQNTESASPLTQEDQVERAAIAKMRAYRLNYRNQTLRVARGEFHRHSEYSFDGNADGSILDQWRYAIDAADLDWIGCCDHDNGGGREYTWWLTQKQTDLFYAPGRFTPPFSYERSVAYPEGHRNVLFAQRGVRTLPRLPKVANDSTGNAPDTVMLYRYLRKFNGLVAAHTSATNQGTDWRDHDPEVETSVEIYQGTRQSYEQPGAPRSNSQKDSISGYQPKGYVDLGLQKGYQLAFEASSDHVSTHMSFANVLTADLTRDALLDGFRKRHLYASTDNILAEFRSGDHIMGDAFSTSSAPVFQVKLAGTAPFAKVFVIKDNAYVYSATPNRADVEFTWQDAKPESGKTSYYYVRGEQADGELVWVTPMWITYTAK